MSHTTSTPDVTQVNVGTPVQSKNTDNTSPMLTTATSTAEATNPAILTISTTNAQPLPRSNHTPLTEEGFQALEAEVRARKQSEKLQEEQRNNGTESLLLTSTSTASSSNTTNGHNITNDTYSNLLLDDNGEGVTTNNTSNSTNQFNQVSLDDDEHEPLSLQGRVEVKSSDSFGDSLISLLKTIWEGAKSVISWPFKKIYNGISSLGSRHTVTDMTSSVNTNRDTDSETSFDRVSSSDSNSILASPARPRAKELTLAQKCEKRTDAFVNSPEFDQVYNKMKKLFDGNKDKENDATEAFKQLKDKLTPFRVVRSVAQNKFNAVELYLSYSKEELANRDTNGAKRKLICEAYYEYDKIKADLKKDKKAKDIETAQNAERTRQNEYDSTFRGFIKDLDDLQKNHEPQEYHLNFMLKQLFEANARVIASDGVYRQAWSRMEDCMTVGYNDDEVIKLEKLLKKCGEQQQLPTDESEKRLLVRAYKIFFRERVTVQREVKDEDRAEIAKLQYLNLNAKAIALKKAYDASESEEVLGDLFTSNGLTEEQYERLATILKDEDEEFFNDGKLSADRQTYQPTEKSDRLLLLKAYDIYSKHIAKPKAKGKAAANPKLSKSKIKIQLAQRQQQQPNDNHTGYGFNQYYSGDNNLSTSFNADYDYMMDNDNYGNLSPSFNSTLSSKPYQSNREKRNSSEYDDNYSNPFAAESGYGTGDDQEADLFSNDSPRRTASSKPYQSNGKKRNSSENADNNDSRLNRNQKPKRKASFTGKASSSGQKKNNNRNNVKVTNFND